MIGTNWLGGIIGDTAGSIYEWHNAEKYDEIAPFKIGCHFTDDTVLTCAVADWLMETEAGDTENEKDILIDKLKTYGHKYPHAGYGGMFHKWLNSTDRAPFNSFGNGSAMRVSACGYIAKSYDAALILAKMSAEVTHNHPEGIKGAQAIAAGIWMARNGYDKESIKHRIEKDFGYNLDKKIEEIHKSHPFDATCQVTVPEAIIAFLESNSFEDCFKKAVWISGDSDTIADMACAIASAYYGIPSNIVEHLFKLLPDDLKTIAIKFSNYEI